MDKEICYFLGVKPGDRAGHFCYVPGYLYAPRDQMVYSPWGNRDIRYQIEELKALAAVGLITFDKYGNQARDGRPETEGEPHFATKDGWTLMAMWDRSADKRGGCMAAFAVNREFKSHSDALLLFRVRFPDVFERIEKHLGKSIGPRDDLAEMVIDFKTRLAAFRARYGRDAVRRHEQGLLLDALDAGAQTTGHDDWANLKDRVKREQENQR